MFYVPNDRRIYPLFQSLLPHHQFDSQKALEPFYFGK